MLQLQLPLFLRESSFRLLPSCVLDSCFFLLVFYMSSNVLLEVLNIRITTLPKSKSTLRHLNYIQKQ